jgi:ATP-dependent helicase IRC3
LLTEGFDFPEIAALVIARPTLSPSLYLQMLGRGTRLAAGKKDCLVLDIMGNNPDISHQVILPYVVGVVRAEGGEESERRERETTDPILKALLGAQTETSLTLLDPIGHSHYRWTAYRGGYFAMVGRHEAAIIERDPKGSGLYRSRLYTMPREQLPEHRWIEQAYLPLRQQVALVHDFTSAISVKALSSKEASWLAEPASEKQLEALQRLHPGLARQARAKGWTKRIASDAITFCLLRNTLMYPPIM